VLKTAWASLRGPWYLIADYQKAKRYYGRPAVQDEFDLRYGVETSTGYTRQISRLTVRTGYLRTAIGPTSTEIISEALSALPIRCEDFVFVDFGSGKGRGLQQALPFPDPKSTNTKSRTESAARKGFANDLSGRGPIAVRKYPVRTVNLEICRVYPGAGLNTVAEIELVLHRRTAIVSFGLLIVRDEVPGSTQRRPRRFEHSSFFERFFNSGQDRL